MAGGCFARCFGGSEAPGDSDSSAPDEQKNSVKILSNNTLGGKASSTGPQDVHEISTSTDPAPAQSAKPTSLAGTDTDRLNGNASVVTSGSGLISLDDDQRSLSDYDGQISGIPAQGITTTSAFGVAQVDPQSPTSQASERTPVAPKDLFVGDFIVNTEDNEDSVEGPISSMAVDLEFETDAPESFVEFPDPRDDAVSRREATLLVRELTRSEGDSVRPMDELMAPVGGSMGLEYRQEEEENFAPDSEMADRNEEMAQVPNADSEGGGGSEGGGEADQFTEPDEFPDQQFEFIGEDEIQEGGNDRNPTTSDADFDIEEPYFADAQEESVVDFDEASSHPDTALTKPPKAGLRSKTQNAAKSRVPMAQARGAWKIQENGPRKSKKEEEEVVKADPAAVKSLSSDDFIAQLIRDQEEQGKKADRKKKKEESQRERGRKEKEDKKVMRESTTYSRPWAQTSLPPRPKPFIPKLDLSRENLRSRPSSVGTRAGVQRRMSHESNASMLSLSRSRGNTHRPGWAGNARHITQLSAPTAPEPLRANRASQRHDMKARPWKDPPPKRPPNAHVMRSVATYDIANPKPLSTARPNAANHTPSPIQPHNAHHMLRNYETQSRKRSDAKEAGRVHKTLDAERKRKALAENSTTKRATDAKHRTEAHNRRTGYTGKAEVVNHHQRGSISSNDRLPLSPGGSNNVKATSRRTWDTPGQEDPLEDPGRHGKEAEAEVVVFDPFAQEPDFEQFRREAAREMEEELAAAKLAGVGVEDEPYVYKPYVFTPMVVQNFSSWLGGGPDAEGEEKHDEAAKPNDDEGEEAGEGGAGEEEPRVGMEEEKANALEGIEENPVGEFTPTGRGSTARRVSTATEFLETREELQQEESLEEDEEEEHPAPSASTVEELQHSFADANHILAEAATSESNGSSIWSRPPIMHLGSEAGSQQERPMVHRLSNGSSELPQEQEPQFTIHKSPPDDGLSSFSDDDNVHMENVAAEGPDAGPTGEEEENPLSPQWKMNTLFQVFGNPEADGEKGGAEAVENGRRSMFPYDERTKPDESLSINKTWSNQLFVEEN